MNTSRERVISVSLNEQLWQEFVRLHPQPVHWLRERIQESLRPSQEQAIGVTAASPASASAAASTTSATTR